MGRIASAFARLTCPGCGVAETVAAHREGADDSAMLWADFPSETDGFRLQVERGAPARAPRVIAAACNSCGVAASIENAMLDRPEGW